MNIQDYLHLYIGCEVKFTLWPQNSGILSGTEGESAIVMLKAFGRTTVAADIVKPLLRPLSDITKEEVADLMGIEGFIKAGNWCAPFFQIAWNDLSDEYHSRHLYLHQMHPNQVLFLLSKGFDLFGLIGAGLAIDKTTLK